MATDALQIYQPDAQVGELKLWRPPEDVLVEAQQAAQALQKRIAGKKKPVIFNNEQYIESDDWEMLAHFYGYVAKIENTEFVEFGDVQGFKAVAVLLNERTGLVVSRAESMCLDEEENWGPRPKYEWQNKLGPDDKPIWDKTAKNGQGAYVREKVQVGEVNTPLFQLMSMAQTRACAKVTRNKLAWVVTLAGYKPTPAEEVTENTLPPEKEAATPLPTEIKRKEPPLTPQQVSSLPTTSTWCECGHVSGQHGAVAPHRCACDGNANGAICGCQAFKAKVRPPDGPTQPLPPRPQQAVPNSQRQPIQSPRPAQVRVISEAQARRFYAISKQHGREPEDVKEFLQSAFGITDDRQIPSTQYERACKWAETGEDF